MTLHKLLYDVKSLPSGRCIFEPKEFIGYKIVVVDEASMAPKNLIDLLLSFPVYVIYLGDPFQLPAIDKSQDHGLLERPHVFLDEIMRQAADSEIIQLSMSIRNGKPLSKFMGKEVRVLPRREFELGMLTWGDITLCAKNKTRTELNAMHREMLGLDPKNLCEGDKIINLRNEWEKIANTGNAMTNGIIGTISNFTFDSELIRGRAAEYPMKINRVTGNFVSETGDNFGRITANSDLLLTGIDPFNDRQKYLLRKRWLLPLEMVYGYAITTWKAQGSEFDKVLGFEENFPFDREEHARYLYTLVTRASSRLVLIMKN